MRLALATLLLLQAPVQSEADKVEAAIKKMTDREYRMIVRKEEIGTLTLKSRVDTEGDRKIAVFESVMKVPREGRIEESTTVEKADLEGLRFLSMKVVGLDGKINYSLEVKDGKVGVKTLEGKTKSIEVTKTTVTEMTLYRFACVREQKVGSTHTLDLFDYHNIQKGYELRCVERKTVELAGAKHDVFIWRLSGESTIDLPDGPLKLKFEYTYWVTPEGLLIRYAMAAGDRKDENVLELKK